MLSVFVSDKADRRLCLTLIVAMLILLYKHANNIGYKTAKRRFSFEMRNLIIFMIVVECGGDPPIFFKTIKNGGSTYFCHL